MQIWFCAKCRIIGALKTDGGDVMSVIHRMGDQHKNAAPKCDVPWLKLQALVPENCDEGIVLWPLEQFTEGVTKD